MYKQESKSAKWIPWIPVISTHPKDTSTKKIWITEYAP